MAGSDPVCITKTPKGGTLVGVSPLLAPVTGGEAAGASPLSVIVTVNGVGVSVWNVTESACTHTIHVPATTTFACPAVCVPAAKQLYAATGTTLTSWGPEATLLSDCASQELPEEPLALYAALNHPYAVVLYEGGRVQQLEAEEDTVKEHQQLQLEIQDGDRCIWGHLAYDKKTRGHQLLVAVVTAENTLMCIKHVTNQSNQFVFASSQELSFDGTAKDILDIAFQWPDRLFVLVQSGSILEFQLSGSPVVASSFAEIPTLRFGAKGGGAIAAMGNTHVGVIGKEKGGSCFQLMQWDSSYNILQTQTKCPSSSKSESVLSLVMLTKSDAVVSTTRGVYSVPVELVPSSLAAVLGSHRTGPSIEEATVVPSLDPTTDDWAASQSDASRKLQKTLTSLCEGKSAATLAAFQKKFDEFVASHAAADGFLLPPSAIQQIVHHCCTTQRYFARQVLLTLLEAGLLTSSEYPDLFKFVMSKSDIEIVLAVLRHVPDLPEDQVVAALCSTWAEDHGPANGGTETDFHSMFRHVMCAAWSEGQLILALKTIGIDQVLDMFELLNFWLDLHADHSSDALREAYTGSIPNLDNVTQWVCYLLDAHFTNLVITTESFPIMLELSNKLQSHTGLSESLWGLQGVLSHLRERRKLATEAAELGSYSLEVLHLY